MPQITKRITLASLHRLMQSQENATLQIRTELSEVNGRITRMDRTQQKIAARLFSIESVQKEQSARLASLEVRVEDLHGMVDNLGGRFARLEQEYVMIVGGLKRLESKFDDLDARRLDERITSLEARLSALESATPKA